jgi:PAS domain S-box-containing protein
MIKESDIFKASILIVDDQIANVQLLVQLLGDAGYTNVTSTMDPLAVRSLHRKHLYDLILLDLKMPVMDGFEVMAGLKTLKNDDYLSVIVLTADPALKLRSLQAGARDFVSKPFDLLEVTTRIRNILEVRLLYKKLANYNKDLVKTVDERTAELRESELRFRSFTELASDWYWEQNDTGEFTTVSGPVFETLGIAATSFLTEKINGDKTGWNEDEHLQLQMKIAARQPFIDFAFSRTNTDGSVQKFRVSGEPMFDDNSRFKGYRGIGVEVTPHP